MNKIIEKGHWFYEYHSSEISLNIAIYWKDKHLFTYRRGRLRKYITVDILKWKLFYIKI